MSATEMNRRQFVSLAGIGAGTLAAMGLAGCSPAKPSLAGTGGSQPAEGSERASSWLGEAPEIAEDQIVRTEATDLLIIGAGNAGMSAAATAADLGMDFMVCDKAGDVQASRHWVGAVNSRWQKEAGINTDTNKLLNELTRYASGKCSQDVWKVWINESGETIEYLNDILAALAWRSTWMWTITITQRVVPTTTFPFNSICGISLRWPKRCLRLFGGTPPLRPEWLATRFWRIISPPRAPRSPSAISWPSLCARRAVVSR